MTQLIIAYQDGTTKKTIDLCRRAEMLNMRFGFNRNSKTSIWSLRAWAAAAVLCMPAAAKVVSVQTGSEFQSALDAAMPGDEIVLQAGMTYTGNFRLRNHGGTTPVTIRTSAVDSLPPAGTRLTPAYAQYLPKVIAPNSTAALIAYGAHKYNLIGIEIAPAPGIYSYTLVDIGPFDAKSVDQLSSNISFDHIYIHGDPVVGAKRGITLNGRSISVRDSWISGIVSNWNETQALLGWNGPGPFTIENNYLEASGENIMFGGAVATIPNMVPCDIDIRSNHIFKQPSWNPSDPSYAGKKWTVKNLLEFKNACRVRVLDNVLENNWVESQSGWAILLTPRAEYGKMPWAVVEDVEIRGNVIRNSPAGITILGQDGSYGGQLRRVTIANNWFDQVGALRLFGIFNSALAVTIDHNTCVTNKHSVIFAEGTPSGDFVASNNVFQNGTYGVIGSGVAPGMNTWNKFFPGHRVDRNVFIGGSSTSYPASNYFPKTLAEVGFADLPAGDYALSSDSVYRSAAADGSPLGADMVGLRASERAAKMGTTSSSNPVVDFSVAVAPNSVVGGSAVTATISLSSKAPKGGLLVTLDSDSLNTRVPPSVAIAEGVQVASFEIPTSAVRVATETTLSARIGTKTKTARVRISSPALAEISLARVEISSGTGPIFEQRIVLNGPAPEGGAVVTLSASHSAISVPASVTVPAGSSTVAFALSATPVTQDVVAQISASFNGLTISRAINVTAPRLAQLNVAPSTIVGGVTTGATYSVSLDRPALTDVRVTLSSSYPAIASVPQSVTVTAGSASAVFAIASHAVPVETPVTVSAAFGTSVKSGVVTVQPPNVVTTPTLATISTYPRAIVGGTTTGPTSMVFLNATSSTPINVALVSSSPSTVAVPQFVTVPPGSLSGAFSITSQLVRADTPVTITAIYGKTVKSSAVLVTAR